MPIGHPVRRVGRSGNRNRPDRAMGPDRRASRSDRDRIAAAGRPPRVPRNAPRRAPHPQKAPEVPRVGHGPTLALDGRRQGRRRGGALPGARRGEKDVRKFPHARRTEKFATFKSRMRLGVAAPAARTSKIDPAEPPATHDASRMLSPGTRNAGFLEREADRKRPWADRLLAALGNPVQRVVGLRMEQGSPLRGADTLGEQFVHEQLAAIAHRQLDAQAIGRD
jgi:hypothetical protein